MPFSHLAELRIREAMEQGKFDNLPGAGKPLDFEEYFAVPEDMRMAYSILKSANCPPAEVQMLKEVASLKEEIAATADAPKRRKLQLVLAYRQAEVALRLERNRRLG